MGYLSEKEKKNIPYHEQVRIAERRDGANDNRKMVARQAEDRGNAVVNCRDIRECMEAKKHYESQGKQVRIVGGTSKPFVFFKRGDK